MKYIHKVNTGFSFLELILVSFPFSIGLLGVFPVLKNIKTNQQDLFLRFKAFKIAENEILNYDSGETTIVHKNEKYLIKKNEINKDGLLTPIVRVNYSNGLTSGNVSLATQKIQN